MSSGFAEALALQEVQRAAVMEICRQASGNNKKGGQAMFKHSKVRQAGLILFATMLLLILPNLTKVIG
ncbi:t-SNARE coiled-coil homology domain-containing protein [Pseudomonas sp. IT-P171]